MLSLLRHSRSSSERLSTYSSFIERAPRTSMYHPPLPTAYNYADLPLPDESSFSSSSGSRAHHYQAYPSPDESDPLLLPSLYPSPTLYSEAGSVLDLEFGFEPGLITPASLYHSPIFEEAHWINSAAPEDVVEGVARQHALELELFEHQVVNNEAGAWNPEPIPSAVPSYTSATFSPSPAPSSPLSSPASSAGDEDHRAPSFPAPSTCEEHDFTPPVALSEHYTSLTTLALKNRLAHGILPPSKPDRTSSTSTESARRQRPAPPHHHDSTTRPLARNNKEGLSCACSACGVAIAQLNFRGKGDSVDVPLIAEYWCLGCAPPESEVDKDEEAVAITYRSTLSGVLDDLQGVATEEEGQQEPSLRRMRPGMERDEDALSCTCSISVLLRGYTDLLDVNRRRLQALLRIRLPSHSRSRRRDRVRNRSRLLQLRQHLLALLRLRWWRWTSSRVRLTARGSSAPR